MTAKAVARDRYVGKESTPLTMQNIDKVTRYRGQTPFENMVAKFMRLQGKTMAETEAPIELGATGLLDGSSSPLPQRGGSGSAGATGGVAQQENNLAEKEASLMASREEAKVKKMEGAMKR